MSEEKVIKPRKKKKKGSKQKGSKLVPKLHRKVKNRELPLPYKQAQKYVVDKIVPLGVDTRLKWHDFDKLPPNIPKHPQNVYKGEGWIGWNQWFAKNIPTEGSAFMFWCLKNEITEKIISKHTKLSVGTVYHTWTECKASKSTICNIAAKIPFIYEEALRIRIKRALSNTRPDKEDVALQSLKEAEISKLISEQTISEDKLTEMIFKHEKKH